MKLIVNTGITSSIAGIERTVCNENDWYLDMLEDGKWLVSHKDTSIGLFSKCEEAVFFYMVKVDPPKPLTEQEEQEAMDSLEELLKQNTQDTAIETLSIQTILERHLPDYSNRGDLDIRNRLAETKKQSHLVDADDLKLYELDTKLLNEVIQVIQDKGQEIDFLIDPASTSVDLFEFYQLLPKPVQKIIESFDDNNDLYKECQRLQAELKPHGLTFDYGLDGAGYNLRLINPEKAVETQSEPDGKSNVQDITDPDTWDWVHTQLVGKKHMNDELGDNDSLCKLVLDRSYEDGDAAHQMLNERYGGDLDNPQIRIDWLEHTAYLMNEAIKKHLDNERESKIV